MFDNIHFYNKDLEHDTIKEFFSYFLVPWGSTTILISDDIQILSYQVVWDTLSFKKRKKKQKYVPCFILILLKM